MVRGRGSSLRRLGKEEKRPPCSFWASVSLPVYPPRPRGSEPAPAAHLGAVGPLLPRLEDATAAALAALVQALQPLQVDAQVQPVGQTALLGRLLAFGGAATAAPAVAVPVRHGDAARLRLPGAAARPALAPLRARRQAQRLKRRKRRPCAARARVGQGAGPGGVGTERVPAELDAGGREKRHLSGVETEGLETPRHRRAPRGRDANPLLPGQSVHFRP